MPDMTAVSTTGTSNACKARMPRRTRKDGANQIPHAAYTEQEGSPQNGTPHADTAEQHPHAERRDGERQHEHADEQPLWSLCPHRNPCSPELNMGCGAYISV